MRAISLIRAVRAATLCVTMLLVGACTVVRAPPAANADGPRPSLAQAEEGYARVLERHVNDRGEVAFAALAADTGAGGIRALEGYVRAIKSTPLDAAPTPNGRLAHVINAYNALSMYNVIASGVPGSHGGFARIEFFVLRRFEIGGRVLSLRAFENEVIRPRGEPRVHFALNCSAVSCPVLPRTPFTAARLDEELDREARNFFARPRNLRVDAATRTIWFNEILSFYTEDFVPGRANSLIEYAQRYATQPLPADYQVRFTPYDWTVANSARQP